MSEDIERLLAEIDSATGSASTPAKKKTGSPPAPSKDANLASSSGGRVGFAVVAAVVFGVIGLVVDLFVPFLLGTFSTGVGAAFGAFLTALVAGPPRWFSS